VVILAEIDARAAGAAAGLLYVGATRARTHLVVIDSEEELQTKRFDSWSLR
jgi:ATP-dependent exoDNAse (exonuclease V) beta subunit